MQPQTLARHADAFTPIALNNEFLSFKLGHEEYGIDILKVQEIRSYEAVTRIADVPDFIKGVVNLRGTIVPVVDMRIRFKQRDISYDQFTVVIVLNIAGRLVGMVVDGVSDVMTLSAEQIRPTPNFSFSKMVASLNLLMESADAGLNEPCRVLSALANNDPTETIASDHQLH